ncbi:MAG: hypothetical protein IPJ84_17185 [Bdellovibrionales bacterium]|nr:hypothetical protein [Bdellovibrionales bacterium]
MGSFRFVASAAMVIIGAFTVHAEADDMEFGPSEKTAASPATTGAVSGDATTLRASPGSTWSAIKRDLSSGFFNFTSIKANEANRGHGSLESYNYLSLEYRLSREEKVFYRPAFLFNFGGSDLRDRDVASKFEWSDGYFGYSSYALPWLPFEMDYKTEIRAYLPTSEISQKNGMISRLRGDLKGYVPLTTRSTFLLWFKPDYFIQSRTASTNDRGFAQGNKHFGYDLSANYYYNATRAIGFGAAVGHEQYWTHASAAENLDVYRTENLNLSAFVGFSYVGFLTHIGFDQSRNIARPRDSFELVRDTETQYFARSYYRF